MMATGKLAKTEVNVQGVMNDSEAMRKIVQEEVQRMITREFKEHMGRTICST